MFALAVFCAILLAVLVWLVLRLRVETNSRISGLLERYGDLEASLNAQRSLALRLETGTREIQQAQAAIASSASDLRVGLEQLRDPLVSLASSQKEELAALRTESAAQLQVILERLTCGFESLASAQKDEIAALRAESTAQAERANAGLESRFEQLSGHLRRVESLASAQRDEMAALQAGAAAKIQSALQGLSDEFRLSASAQQEEIVALRAALSASEDTQFQDPMPNLDAEAPSQVSEIASRLAVLRPLVPYPDWHFDADWRNTEMAFRVRRSIWTYFNRRKLAAPLTVDWYYGTKVQIYLGNDLSRQLFISGCIDPNEFLTLDKLLRPGMTFVDVGANEGIYSLFASARVGPSGSVWAFEPSAREVGRIDANVKLNGLHNIRSLPIALADVNGKGKLLVAGYEHEGHNTLGAFIYDTVLQQQETVPLRRLDSIVDEFEIERVDFLKIDVEGAELKVLSGARQTLERHRPIVLFEANNRALEQQGTGADELVRFLAAQSFRIYLYDRATGFPAVAGDGCFSENMLAVPAERSLPESIFVPVPVAVPDF